MTHPGGRVQIWVGDGEDSGGSVLESVLEGVPVGVAEGVSAAVELSSGDVGVPMGVPV